MKDITTILILLTLSLIICEEVKKHSRVIKAEELFSLSLAESQFGIEYWKIENYQEIKNSSIQYIISQPARM